jgi:hypothetical protein
LSRITGVRGAYIQCSPRWRDTLGEVGAGGVGSCCGLVGDHLIFGDDEPVGVAFGQVEERVDSPAVQGWPPGDPLEGSPSAAAVGPEALPDVAAVSAGGKQWQSGVCEQFGDRVGVDVAGGVYSWWEPAGVEAEAVEWLPVSGAVERLPRSLGDVRGG